MRVSPLQYTEPHVTVMSLQGCKLPALLLRSVQPTSACGHHSDRPEGEYVMKREVEIGELLQTVMSLFQ